MFGINLMDITNDTQASEKEDLRKIPRFVNVGLL
jgi:hypothetical protein